MAEKLITLEEAETLQRAAKNYASKAFATIGTATLLSGNWQEDNTADYPAYYDISLAGVLATDRADILFSGANLATAAECGISAITETSAGKIRIRAAEAPTTNITATYWITHKEESE